MCDLDGTLIDTMPILADLATDVMNEIYGTPRSLGRELYLATSGLPFIRQLGIIYPGDARNRAASDVFEARKPDRCRAVKMSDETRGGLGRLRKQGARIVVSSNNGTDNVEAFARNADFPFDLVLGFGAGSSKGRPHLDRAARDFGATRKEMLFVGDSLHDGEMAENEEVPFVAVAGTFSRERFTLRFPGVPVVQRFSEVPALF